MSKETVSPQQAPAQEMESASGEMEGASMSPPAFQLVASADNADAQNTPAGDGSVQERFQSHSLTAEDLTDAYVTGEFAKLSIEELFEYRRQSTDTAVKAHILTLIDAREQDPYQSYLGKKFTIENANAVIRDRNGTALTYAEGDTLPAGKRVGDNKIIPNGTEVYVTDIREDLVYVHCEDWGWTSIDNIRGGMFNETMTIDRAEYESQDPNHKTIGDPSASIRSNAAQTTFPEANPSSAIPKDTHVTVVEQTDADRGNSLVQLPDGGQVWTRTGNLSSQPNDDGTYTVTDRDARIREKSVVYPVSSGTIPQGNRVIIVEESQDTEVVGKYVKVAYTRQDESGNYVRDESREAVWTSATNLVDHWADYKSDNARWMKSSTPGKGQYLGQMDVVTLIGRDSSSGDQEVEKLSPQLLGHYNTLRQQASAAGHDIRLNSGFRSFPEQQSLWDANPNPARVARPGRSNHQNGIAIDINTGSFTSSLYLWMRDNAPALGWIRTVSGEHWHWEQRPTDAAAHGHKMPGINP